MSGVKVARNLQRNKRSRNVPVVCKFNPLLLSASSWWNTIKVTTANHIDALNFFNSSKKHDLHCDNLCVDVSNCIKNSDLDPPEEKYGFSEIEIFIEFKYHISNNLFRDKPLPKGAFFHNTGSSKGTLWQMDSYTVAVFRIQFHIHLYLILIYGKYA